MTPCPCQYGKSQHCKWQRHDGCQTNLNTAESAETYLTGTIDSFPVYVNGFPHRWVCPCDCHAAPPVQLTLFGAPA